MLRSIILLVCLCPHFIFCVYVHGRGEAHGGRKPAANGGGGQEGYWRRGREVAGTKILEVVGSKKKRTKL